MQSPSYPTSVQVKWNRQSITFPLPLMAFVESTSFCSPVLLKKPSRPIVFLFSLFLLFQVAFSQVSYTDFGINKGQLPILFLFLLKKFFAPLFCIRCFSFNCVFQVLVICFLHQSMSSSETRSASCFCYSEDTRMLVITQVVLLVFPQLQKLYNSNMADIIMAEMSSGGPVGLLRCLCSN